MSLQIEARIEKQEVMPSFVFYSFCPDIDRFTRYLCEL